MIPTRALIFAAVAAFSCAADAFAQATPPRLVLTDDAAELDAAMAARTPPRDLALRLVAVSLPDIDPSKVRLLIVADVAGADVGLSAASTLASVAFVVEDDRGQIRARGLRRRGLPAVGSGRLGFSEAVAVVPGSYRVKLAAMWNGKVGAMQATATARLQSAAGTVRVGDLAVGEAAGEDLAQSVAVDGQIRGDALVASLGLAANGSLLPEGLTIAVDVARAAAGPAMMSAPAALLASAGDGRTAQAVVDVRALPPGDYVARAVVSLSGAEAARVATPFRREAAAATSARAATPAAPAPTRGRGAAASPVPAAGFRAEDVLDPSVLRPFLDELVARAPDRAKAAIDQARAGRLVEAAQAAGSGDADDPAKPFLQGLSLFSQKQLQAASEAFRETLRAAPDFFVGAFYIGACYAAGGRDPQAVNAWQTSLVGLEGYPVVFRLLADALTRMGQPVRALEVLEEAAAKWPADAGIRLRAARAALDARLYERVFALVDESVRGQASADLLLAGVQAVYEQASQRADGPVADELARARRYRDAYVAAAGPQQALVAEWLAALERKK
jgi:tetratricopeptide (TPR) repeat protein